MTATVNIQAVSATEAQDERFVPTHVWWSRAEDLITGKTPGFVMTFGGTPDEQDLAINSAIVCLTKYRKRAAKAGRLKERVYLMAKRGPQLYVWTVTPQEARKHWKSYDKWMTK